MMKNRICVARWVVTVACLTFLFPPPFASATAQQIIQPQMVQPQLGQPNTASEVLSVEKIFGENRFATDTFNPVWEEEGAKFIRRKPSAEIPGAVDLIATEPLTGTDEILIAANQLVPVGQEKPLSVDAHFWSSDRKLALIYTNTRKVWRHNSRGDYWILNRESGELKQIGVDRPGSSLMFAKLSPDDSKVAYVSEGDLYLEEIATGTVKRLTEKRTPEIINGTSDWVYEEEFDLKDCFRWSPDSQKIFYWEFDTSEVGEFSIINNTDSLYPTIKKFKHTKAGHTNSAVRVGILNLSDGQTTWVKLDGDPRENYPARARWMGPDRVMIQHLNRLQNTNTVLIADAGTGEVRTLFQDKDEAWVETNDQIKDLDGGKQFTWLSEKDGWRSLYIVDAESGEMKRVTTGEYDVIELLRVTSDSVFMIASPTSPTERFLYQVPIGGGEPKRITPAGTKGWNTYSVSPDGSIAVHTNSSFGVPPTCQLVRLPNHESLRVITNNQKVRDQLAALQPVKTEFVKIGVGGTTLDAWVMKPIGLDLYKEYPLIVHVYGEPWGTTVTNSWGNSNYLWHRMLVEKGYAVCSIDNRGTNVPRGSKFRKSVYRKIGILPAADQASAVKSLLKHYSWLDETRVGVWGWSGGGSMTLNAMLKYPEIYHVGISVAPVPDQRYYDSIYQERYMGTPQGNPEGYRDGSPINFAKNLKGDLMVIHGTGDDNCHYQTVELLINEFVKHNKMFSMLAYPNRSHSINEGENTSLHLRNSMTKYFLDHLKPGPE
jgi:dipeptidyl-peptidase-4